MDGVEGESHPYFAARIMGRLFGPKWHDFCLYHSRFLAKQHDKPFSRLCVADKLSIYYTPAWLYLPMVRWTGEIREYMRDAQEGKYLSMNLATANQLAWFRSVQEYLHKWAMEHKDERPDTWTPNTKQAKDQFGTWQ